MIKRKWFTTLPDTSLCLLWWRSPGDDSIICHIQIDICRPSHWNCQKPAPHNHERSSQMQVHTYTLHFSWRRPFSTSQKKWLERCWLAPWRSGWAFLQRPYLSNIFASRWQWMQACFAQPSVQEHTPDHHGSSEQVRSDHLEEVEAKKSSPRQICIFW